MKLRPYTPIHAACDRELARRTLGGSIFHPVLLGLLLSTLPSTLRETLLIQALSSSIFTLSLVRLAIIWLQERIYKTHPALWNRLFNGTGLVVATSWGILFATVSAHTTEISDLSAAYLAMAGLSSGAAASLFPRLWLARIYVTLTIFPLSAVEAMSASDTAIQSALVAGTLNLFLWIQIGRAHSDYWQSITQREDANAKKQRLDFLMEATGTGVWDWDLVERVSYMSSAFVKDYGASPTTHAPWENLLPFLSAEDRERITQSIDKCIKSATSTSVEFKMLQQESEQWLSLVFHPVASATGRVVRIIGSTLDITARKMLELEHAESQVKMETASRLASLGEMAGGIAHEVNTPLSAIILNAEHLLEMSQSGKLEPSLVIKDTQAIHRTATHIAHIVRSLRTFSRDASHDPQTTSALSQLVADAMMFCGEKIKNHGITFHSVPFRSDWKVDARSTEIVQMLLNLLNNAYDAVTQLPEKWIRLDVAEAGKFLEISISDSGHGIPKDIQVKLMQPFFTTKGVGQGTGLGLSFARGVAESHGGQLIFDEGASNTRFVILLPRSAERTAEATVG